MSKWKERIPGIVISVILVAVFAVFMVILLQSKMVPTKLLILGGIALVLLVASAVLLVRSIRNKGQFICGASLSLVLALVLGLASNYISVATALQAAGYCVLASTMRGIAVSLSYSLST